MSQIYIKGVPYQRFLVLLKNIHSWHTLHEISVYMITIFNHWNWIRVVLFFFWKFILGDGRQGGGGCQLCIYIEKEISNTLSKKWSNPEKWFKLISRASLITGFLVLLKNIHIWMCIKSLVSYLRWGLL